MPFFKRSIDQIEAFRISPSDSNYFAILADRQAGECASVAVIEIFAVGGRTPPNTHQAADELFFVLSGEGVAWCDGERTTLKKGDALLVKPGSEHVVENTGAGKLYTLTVMMPDEAFGALIRSGTPVVLDDEDRRVLCA
ncbi:cupin domain-containing protein [Gluconacetobacter tumulicola]|uniref:Cupin domain-containing protein n=1 Tax=Gluconacetobacter tumulicola TaxID=1017177 RepID=A0A7W4JEU6_9PROT|nr:cupin domain-containing protein [Gluconacetobacter tumulicola]MBB2179883.1 cupin domain-containing protein [Gluconacetobacter tumulicola]